MGFDREGVSPLTFEEVMILESRCRVFLTCIVPVDKDMPFLVLFRHTVLINSQQL